jgi:hypothetical protein
MRRLSLMCLTATLAFAAATAHAQGGDLSGVTMRVLDDVSDIDAVILELDASRGEDEQGAERSRGAATGAEQSGRGDAAEASDADAEADRLDDGREGEELHDPAVDERSEGRLEDRDVERPAAVEPTP